MATITLDGNDYPSFSDLASADILLAGDVLRAIPWGRRDDPAKMRGLISATRMLQRMPWNDPAPTTDDPPAVVAEVTAMLAADLLAKPKLFTDATGASNVKIARAGSAQVEFFRPVAGGPPMPKDLWDLLVAAGLIGSFDDPDGGGAEVTGISSGCRPYLGRYVDDSTPGYGAQDLG
jgi:hypothetical protein